MSIVRARWTGAPVRNSRKTDSLRRIAVWGRAIAACVLLSTFAGAQTKVGIPLPPQGAPTAVKSALDKKTMEEYARHLFLWPPQVTVTVSDPKPSEVAGLSEVKVVASAGGASQEELFFVTKDGAKIIRGTTFDVAQSPFQREMDTIKNDLQPSMGTAGAPVVITLFSDFQCNYCKEEAKVLRQNLLTAYPKEVRMYFRDFPIDQIHPWARTASIAGRCVFRAKPQAFWDYHDWIFEKQTEITVENLKPKVMEFVQSKGLDAIQVGTCIDSRATEAEINKSIAEGRALKVDATPTMFVNGRRIPGNIPWPNLKMVIDWDLDFSKRTGIQGEKCCQVTLPSPLNR